MLMGMKQKKNIFLKKIQNGQIKINPKKNPKWPTQIPIPPILIIFSRKFQGLVLGLVRLIDAKGIGIAQSIWS